MKMNIRLHITKLSLHLKKNIFIYHLSKNNFNISKTADSINLSRVSLHKKIKEYQIQLSDISKNCKL